MKMNAKQKHILTYAASIGLALAVGGLSAWVNEGNFETPELTAPPLSPPAWLFPIVWAVLFILMGISAARIYLSDDPGRSDALFVYATQLAVNFLWTVFYFRFRALALSFFWLVFLLALVLLMIRRFEAVRPGSGKLQIPYALWLCFALYLNLATWLINR